MSRLVHRVAEPASEPLGTLLCVHGYPEASHIWRDLLARRRAGRVAGGRPRPAGIR